MAYPTNVDVYDRRLEKLLKEDREREERTYKLAQEARAAQDKWLRDNRNKIDSTSQTMNRAMRSILVNSTYGKFQSEYECTFHKDLKVEDKLGGRPSARYQPPIRTLPDREQRILEIFDNNKSFTEKLQDEIDSWLKPVRILTNV